MQRITTQLEEILSQQQQILSAVSQNSNRIMSLRTDLETVQNNVIKLQLLSSSIQVPLCLPKFRSAPSNFQNLFF